MYGKLLLCEQFQPKNVLKVIPVSKDNYFIGGSILYCDLRLYVDRVVPDKVCVISGSQNNANLRNLSNATILINGKKLQTNDVSLSDNDEISLYGIKFRWVYCSENEEPVNSKKRQRISVDLPIAVVKPLNFNDKATNRRKVNSLLPTQLQSSTSQFSKDFKSKNPIKKKSAKQLRKSGVNRKQTNRFTVETVNDTDASNTSPKQSKRTGDLPSTSGAGVSKIKELANLITSRTENVELDERNKNRKYKKRVSERIIQSARVTRAGNRSSLTTKSIKKRKMPSLPVNKARYSNLRKSSSLKATKTTKKSLTKVQLERQRSMKSPVVPVSKSSASSDGCSTPPVESTDKEDSPRTPSDRGIPEITLRSSKKHSTQRQMYDQITPINNRIMSAASSRSLLNIFNDEGKTPAAKRRKLNDSAKIVRENRASIFRAEYNRNKSFLFNLQTPKSININKQPQDVISTPAIIEGNSGRTLNNSLKINSVQFDDAVNSSKCVKKEYPKSPFVRKFLTKAEITTKSNDEPQSEIDSTEMFTALKLIPTSDIKLSNPKSKSWKKSFTSSSIRPISEMFSKRSVNFISEDNNVANGSVIEKSDVKSILKSFNKLNEALTPKVSENVKRQLTFIVSESAEPSTSRFSGNTVYCTPNRSESNIETDADTYHSLIESEQSLNENEELSNAMKRQLLGGFLEFSNTKDRNNWLNFEIAKRKRSIVASNDTSQNNISRNNSDKRRLTFNKSPSASYFGSTANSHAIPSTSKQADIQELTFSKNPSTSYFGSTSTSNSYAVPSTSKQADLQDLTYSQSPSTSYFGSTSTNNSYAIPSTSKQADLKELQNDFEPNGSTNSNHFIPWESEKQSPLNVSSQTSVELVENQSDLDSDNIRQLFHAKNEDEDPRNLANILRMKLNNRFVTNNVNKSNSNDNDLTSPPGFSGILKMNAEIAPPKRTVVDSPKLDGIQRLFEDSDRKSYVLNSDAVKRLFLPDTAVERNVDDNSVERMEEISSESTPQITKNKNQNKLELRRLHIDMVDEVSKSANRTLKMLKKRNTNLLNTDGVKSRRELFQESIQSEANTDVEVSPNSDEIEPVEIIENVEQTSDITLQNMNSAVLLPKQLAISKIISTDKNERVLKILAQLHIDMSDDTAAVMREIKNNVAENFSSQSVTGVRNTRANIKNKQRPLDGKNDTNNKKSDASSNVPKKRKHRNGEEEASTSQVIKSEEPSKRITFEDKASTSKVVKPRKQTGFKDETSTSEVGKPRKRDTSKDEDSSKLVKPRKQVGSKDKANASEVVKRRKRAASKDEAGSSKIVKPRKRAASKNEAGSSKVVKPRKQVGSKDKANASEVVKRRKQADCKDEASSPKIMKLRKRAASKDEAGSSKIVKPRKRAASKDEAGSSKVVKPRKQVGSKDKANASEVVKRRKQADCKDEASSPKIMKLRKRAASKDEVSSSKVVKCRKSVVYKAKISTLKVVKSLRLQAASKNEASTSKVVEARKPASSKTKSRSSKVSKPLKPVVSNKEETSSEVKKSRKPLVSKKEASSSKVSKSRKPASSKTKSRSSKVAKLLKPVVSNEEETSSKVEKSRKPPVSKKEASTSKVSKSRKPASSKTKSRSSKVAKLLKPVVSNEEETSSEVEKSRKPPVSKKEASTSKVSKSRKPVVSNEEATSSEVKKSRKPAVSKEKTSISNCVESVKGPLKRAESLKTENINKLKQGKVTANNSLIAIKKRKSKQKKYLNLMNRTCLSNIIEETSRQLLNATFEKRVTRKMARKSLNVQTIQRKKKTKKCK